MRKHAAAQKTAGKQHDARLRRLGPMPAEYKPLAVYNAECARGIVHTAEYDASMAWLQRQYDEWAALSPAVTTRHG